MENKTAVEILILKIEDLIPNDKKILMFGLFEQAKELEKQQSIEDMQTAWNSSEQNMRFQFGNSHYKNVTFEQWLAVYKNKDYETDK